jgi:hypothetical protein
MKKGTRFELICDLEAEGLKRGQIVTLYKDVPDYWEEEESIYEYESDRKQSYIHRANLRQIGHNFKPGEAVLLKRNHKTYHLHWSTKLDWLLGRYVVIKEVHDSEKNFFSIRESDCLVSGEWLVPVNETFVNETFNNMNSRDLKVGDKVAFVRKDSHRVTWMPSMDKMFGRIVTISNIVESSIRLKECERGFWYDQNWFDLVPETQTEVIDFKSTIKNSIVGLGAKLVFETGEVCRVIGRDSPERYFSARENYSLKTIGPSDRFYIEKEDNPDYVIEIGDKARVIGSLECVTMGTLVTITGIATGEWCSVDCSTMQIHIGRLLKDVELSKNKSVTASVVDNDTSVTISGKPYKTSDNNEDLYLKRDSLREGDKFEVIAEDSMCSALKIGDILTLTFNDGSLRPKFRHNQPFFPEEIWFSLTCLKQINQKQEFKEGDKVKIVSKTGGRLDWIVGMDEYFGKVLTIEKISNTGSVQVKGKGSYYYDPAWLELINNNNNNNNNITKLEKDERNISNISSTIDLRGSSRSDSISIGDGGKSFPSRGRPTTNTGRYFGNSQSYSSRNPRIEQGKKCPTT